MNIFIKDEAIDACYRRDLPSAEWGKIIGSVRNQTDLIDLISSMLVGGPDGNVDLSEYAQKQWVTDLFNTIETMTPEEVAQMIAASSATTIDELKQWVENKNYLTEHQSLEGYATEQYVQEQIAQIPTGETVDLSGYYTSAQTDSKIAQASAATMQKVESKGYLTEHQSLNGKQDVIKDLQAIRDGAQKGATALQKHQSLSGYATEAYVNQKVSEIPTTDLSGYYTSAQTDSKVAQASAATMQEVENKGYLTEHQDISGKQDVITDLDTIRQGAEKGMTALQEHQSLDGYATEEYVNQEISKIPTVDLSGYYTSAQTNDAIAQSSAATMQEVESKGYLTEHQSLDGYATIEDLNKPFLLQGNKLVYFEIHGEWELKRAIEDGYSPHVINSVSSWLNKPLVKSVKVNGRLITENYPGGAGIDQQAMDEVVVVEVEFTTGDISNLEMDYIGAQLGAGVVFGTGITKLPDNMFSEFYGCAIWQCSDEMIPVDNGRGRGTIHKNWFGDPLYFFFANPSSKPQAYEWYVDWSDGSNSHGWLENQNELEKRGIVTMPYVPNSSIVEVAYGYIRNIASRNYLRTVHINTLIGDIESELTRLSETI